MRLPGRRLRRARVRISATYPQPTATGEQSYEITPELYAGPWQLKPGTVLEVVSEPKEEK